MMMEGRMVIKHLFYVEGFCGCLAYFCYNYQPRKLMPLRIVQYVNQFLLSKSFSLYVVYREETLIGFVHARTEKGRFGLDEIIWILGSDMRLKTFKFQKNRSGAIPQSMLVRLTNMLAGLDLIRVTNVLRTEPNLNQRDRVIISSAVKALFVTKAIWPQAQSSLTQSSELSGSALSSVL